MSRAMAHASLLLTSLGVAYASTSQYTEYVVDPTWKPNFPEGVDIFSAVGVSGDRVIVDQRNGKYKDPFIVLDKKSGEMLFSFGGKDIAMKFNRSNCNSMPSCYGSHGLAVQPADPSVGRDEDTIWAMDFFNDTILSYNLRGELQAMAGRAGTPSADVDKFDHPADATFRKNSAFFVDGDGGHNNRIEKWAAASGKPEHVEWVRPTKPPSQRAAEEYINPHGICWHEASDRLLIADREHSRIAIVHPDTGLEEGNLTCDALQLGSKGKPFGVRTIGNTLFLAVSDNPQDGNNLFLHIVDISTMSKDRSCKKLLQTITFAKSASVFRKPGVFVCNGPHLMGVDRETNDVYLACVAEPGSNFLRLSPKKDTIGRVVV